MLEFLQLQNILLIKTLNVNLRGEKFGQLMVLSKDIYCFKWVVYRVKVAALSLLSENVLKYSCALNYCKGTSNTF